MERAELSGGARERRPRERRVVKGEVFLVWKRPGWWRSPALAHTSDSFVASRCACSTIPPSQFHSPFHEMLKVLRFGRESEVSDRAILGGIYVLILYFVLPDIITESVESDIRTGGSCHRGAECGQSMRLVPQRQAQEGTES